MYKSGQTQYNRKIPPYPTICGTHASMKVTIRVGFNSLREVYHFFLSSQSFLALFWLFMYCKSPIFSYSNRTTNTRVFYSIFSHIEVSMDGVMPSLSSIFNVRKNSMFVVKLLGIMSSILFYYKSNTKNLGNLFLDCLLLCPLFHSIWVSSMRNIEISRV